MPATLLSPILLIEIEGLGEVFQPNFSHSKNKEKKKKAMIFESPGKGFALDLDGAKKLPDGFLSSFHVSGFTP